MHNAQIKVKQPKDLIRRRLVRWPSYKYYCIHCRAGKFYISRNIFSWKEFYPFSSSASDTWLIFFIFTAFHVNKNHVARWEWFWNTIILVRRSVEKKQKWETPKMELESIPLNQQIVIYASNSQRLLPNTPCTCAICHPTKRVVLFQCVTRCVKFESRESL